MTFSYNAEIETKKSKIKNQKRYIKKNQQILKYKSESITEIFWGYVFALKKSGLIFNCKVLDFTVSMH